MPGLPDRPPRPCRGTRRIDLGGVGTGRGQRHAGGADSAACAQGARRQRRTPGHGAYRAALRLPMGRAGARGGDLSRAARHRGGRLGRRRGEPTLAHGRSFADTDAAIAQALALALVRRGHRTGRGTRFGAAVVAQPDPAAPATTMPVQTLALVLPVTVAPAEAETSWVRLGAMDYIASRLRRSGMKVVPSDQTLHLERFDGNSRRFHGAGLATAWPRQWRTLDPRAGGQPRQLWLARAPGMARSRPGARDRSARQYAPGRRRQRHRQLAASPGPARSGGFADAAGRTPAADRRRTHRRSAGHRTATVGTSPRGAAHRPALAGPASAVGLPFRPDRPGRTAIPGAVGAKSRSGRCRRARAR